MKRYIITALSFCLAAGLTLSAQVTREEAARDTTLLAGLLRPYPGPLQTRYTKPPRGYKPFYISHIARHGSRWHTSAKIYERPIEVLSAAREEGVLTPAGEDVLRRMQALWENAEGRIGELTPLGFEQHRGVADRMYKHYRKVFKKGRKVRAESTPSGRVMMSMYSFVNRLIEGSPKLDVVMDASYRCKANVAHTSGISSQYTKNCQRRKDYKVWEQTTYHPQRLMGVLFSDTAYVAAKVQQDLLMSDLYEAACIALDMPTDVRLMDIFTLDELYDLWQGRSAGYYTSNGPDPVAGDSLLCKAVPILQDIIRKADRAIADPSIAADLRFSHDAYLAPLTTTLQLEGFRGAAQDFEQMALVWADSKASPMCVNIQAIFYKNRRGRVLVKFMHNEKECGIPIEPVKYPYYDWQEAKAFYASQYGLEINQKMW